MRKFLTIAAGGAVALVAVGVFALSVQWLLWGNTTSINIFNRSSVPLHSVAVVVPGPTSSGSTNEMPLGSDVAFSAGTRLVLPIRVAYDAGGQHHETSRRVILPAIGAYIISIYIDEQMQVSIKPRILW
jgi:hypothetical protein